MKRLSFFVIITALVAGYSTVQCSETMPDTLYVSPQNNSVFSLRNMDNLPCIFGTTRQLSGSTAVTPDSICIDISADLRTLLPNDRITHYILATADHPHCRIAAVSRPGWTSWPEVGDTLITSGTITVGGEEFAVSPTVIVRRTRPGGIPWVALSIDIPVERTQDTPRRWLYGALNSVTVEAVVFASTRRVQPTTHEFESATMASNQDVQHGYDIAKEFRYPEVSVEHLFLASLRLTDSPMVRLLTRHGIDVEAFRQRLEQHLREASPDSPSAAPRLTQTAQDVFQTGSHQTAHRLGATRTALVHFLLSVLQHNTTPTARLLNEFGCTYDEVNSRYAETPRPAAQITYLGNPFHQESRENDSFNDSRSVADMFFWDGRIYFGHGDWNRNTGPIPVVSYDPATARFTTEFIADDEAIERYRVADGKLVFPGIDPRDSWDFGNFFVLDENGWRKVRTMPNGLHAFDIAWFNDTLFVAGRKQRITERVATVWRSTDFGQTWDEFYLPAGRAWRIFSCGGKLYVFTDREQVYRYTGTGFEPVSVDLLPEEYGRRMRNISKVTHIGDRIVYIGRSEQGFGRPYTAYTADRIDHIERLEFPRNDMPFDFIARGDTLYAATYRFQDISQPYSVIIYRSLNLDEWEEVVQFTLLTASHPTSFEYDGQWFYIGCGQLSNERCGDIYRVLPPR